MQEKLFLLCTKYNNNNNDDNYIEHFLNAIAYHISFK